MKNKIFNISGRVADRERNQGIPGLRVEAWDKDLIIDDALGSAITNKDGSFRITFDESYFRELFLDREPDLYFLVYNRGKLVKSTKDSIIWNVRDQDTVIDIALEKALTPNKPTQPEYSQKDRYQGEDIIKRAASTRRSDALFRAMSTDFLLREQFITDPSQVMSEYVHSKNLLPENAEVSNQLLYSVMSNPGLLRWLRDYSIMLNGRQPSREKFIIDFGQAVVENKGYHVLFALARSAVEKETIYGFDEVLLPVIFGIFTRGGIFQTGTEMSTGTYATEQSGTHMSTGSIVGSGTEMSTGTYATEQSGTHMSTGSIVGSGTEMSTGTYATQQSGTHMSTGSIVGSGTEMSTGTYATEQSGTHMSTGNIFGSGTEMSTGTYATEQSGTHMSTGNIFGSGTEMSTGTYATEQSGTHMSTGHITGLFYSRYALVTLEALVQYATQLRNTGALDVVFMRRR